MFDDQNVGSNKMTTEGVFILFKKTDFNNMLACLGGMVYRSWGVGVSLAHRDRTLPLRRTAAGAVNWYRHGAGGVQSRMQSRGGTREQRERRGGGGHQWHSTRCRAWAQKTCSINSSTGYG
jgi:hypothetical protein